MNSFRAEFLLSVDLSPPGRVIGYLSELFLEFFKSRLVLCIEEIDDGVERGGGNVCSFHHWESLCGV